MFWNRYLINKYFEDKEPAIKWGQDHGLLPKEIKCQAHQQVLKIDTTRKGLGEARCRKGNCRDKSATMLSKGTWFEVSRLSIYQEMSIILGYADNESYEKVMKETARPKEILPQPSDLEATSILGSKTIADRFQDLRRLIMEDFLERQEYRGKIGGPGKIVQIDESKFGKPKP
jgi:hypothetical protein